MDIAANIKTSNNQINELEEEEAPLKDVNDKPNNGITNKATTKDKKVALGIFIAVLLTLSIVWFVASRASSEEENSENEAGTFFKQANANTFTINSAGEIKSRLNSKTDESIYSFLSRHHETAALSEGKHNIVSEILLALEHESTEVGIPVIIEIFSELAASWPKVNITHNARNVIRSQILLLKSAIASSSEGLTLEQKEERDSREASQIVKVKETMAKLVYDGELQVDAAQISLFKQETNAKSLIAFLRNAIDAADAKSYLDRIYFIKVNILDKNKEKLTDAQLLKCMEKLKELELFVADKESVNSMIRELIVKGFQKENSSKRGGNKMV